MKKLLFALMAVVLCVGLMGSAFAYFTDVETSTSNIMSAGTLDIQIGDGDEDYTNSGVSASLNSPDGLAPGDEFVAGPVKIKNVGTIDIQRIYARFGNYSESEGSHPDPEYYSSANNIGDYLKLLYYAESIDEGTTWAYETFVDGLPEGGQGAANAVAYIDYWNSRGAGIPADGVISLKDLWRVRNFGSGDHITSLCMLDGGNAPGPLAPDNIIWFKFKFQLVPEAPNAIQGDVVSFDVNFIASQRTTYPDETLADSVTESIVP